MNDGPELVREDLEVDGLSAELATKFESFPLDFIEYRVRQECARWSTVPVRDFVPIFVERAMRAKLREL